MQAGGRRFDPVQLHQRSKPLASCDTRRRHQNPEANGARAFCLWFREMRYRLFFNNAEEVKRILLEQRDEGRLRLSSGGKGGMG